MKNSFFSLFAVLTILCISCVLADNDELVRSNEAILHKKLLTAYDKDNRPVKDHNKPVNVTMRIALKALQFSSEWARTEVVNIKSWINLRWFDEFLTWNPSDYGELKEVLIHSSKIWLPDLSLYNSLNPSPSRFNFPCQVSYQGRVKCIPQVSHVALCSANYKNWPYDRHNCTLTFGTWMQRGEQVNFNLGNNTIILSDYRPNKFWKLLNVKASRDDGVFACCPNETYPTVMFVFEIERHSAVVATVLITPAIVMITLTVISLCLDIVSIERLIVMFFNIGCHFFYLDNLRGYVPSAGDILPDAVVYFRDSTILSCIVLFHCIILRNLVVYKTTIPNWATRVIEFMNTKGGKIVFHEFSPSDNVNIIAEDSENLTKDETQPSVNADWKKLALFLNRTFTITVIVTYFILILVYLM